MTSISQIHFQRNETTRDRRDAMASHRAHVMRHVLAAWKSPRDSLCILGAGNANDIDLSQLVERFNCVTLVDLDERALSHAVGNLEPAVRMKINALAGCDVTGILPELDALPRSAEILDDAALKKVITNAGCAIPPLRERFDVVVSACILSQLIDSVCIAVPPQSAGGAALLMAVRNHHLDVLVNLLTINGRGILVTDFVATETAPELAWLPDDRIPDAAIQWINQRNFFTGTNPYAIGDYLRKLVGSRLAVRDIQVFPAWRWNLGAKQLAVSAVTFKRGDAIAP